LLVELSCASFGALLSSISGMIRWASALPNSTPHWSNESMLHTVPCVKTACSIERNELADGGGGEAVEHDHVRRAVAVEDAVRDQPLRRALGADFLGGLAEGQRLGLREDVGDEDVVMAAQRRPLVVEGDEVAGDEPRALVDEFVEGVLAVGSGPSPGSSRRWIRAAAAHLMRWRRTGSRKMPGTMTRRCSPLCIRCGRA